VTDKTWTAFAASRYHPSAEHPIHRMHRELDEEIGRQADALLEKLGRSV
jgi:hypothetical protein